MRIGIDFDDTLVNTTEVAKKFLNVYLPGNNLKGYHELPISEQIKFFDKYYIDITQNLDIYEDAIDTMNFFKQMGCELYLITARGMKGNKIIEETKKFIEKNNIPFDKLVFNANNKVNECINNNIDIMIDDLDKNIEALIQNNVKVLKYGCNDSIYPCALNWKEVKLKILNYIK